MADCCIWAARPPNQPGRSHRGTEARAMLASRCFVSDSINLAICSCKSEHPSTCSGLCAGTKLIKAENRSFSNSRDTDHELLLFGEMYLAHCISR